METEAGNEMFCDEMRYRFWQSARLNVSSKNV